MKSIKSPKKYVQKDKMEPPSNVKATKSAIEEQKFYEEKQSEELPSVPLRKYETYNEGL